MDNLQNIDLTIEEIEITTPKMDMADVQAGCWGDSGSDWANLC